MQSGCPHSLGGFYSAFQHRSNVGARSSPQAINVTPVPVVHPENEIQNNMVASPYPGELGVAHGPARLQKSYGQSQQNSQGLHHQQESLVSTVSTGSQPPIWTNTTTKLYSSADFYSSAHISAQHGSNFGTSVNGYSVRQSVDKSGQQREYSKENFSRHFLKESDLDKNTGLQQRKHFSNGSNSAALQGDSLEVAQTIPQKVQCSSAQKTSPMLFDLLTENPPESKSFTSTSSLSEETNANMALNTVTHVSGRRHHKDLQVKDSLAALNCGQTRRQHLHHSGGTPSTSHQQQVSFPSLSHQPSTDKVLSVGETEPPTSVEIHAFIAEKLAYFRDCLTKKNRNDRHANKELGRDSTLQSMQSHLPTTSASKEEDLERQSLNCAAKEYYAAVGQALEEDSSKSSKANAELMPQFNETRDCATSASEKHSTGILDTAVENSKHSPKNVSVEKSALVVFDLSLKKHLDISMPANSHCKLVYSDDCEDTFISNNDESFRSKWCDKYLKNGMSTLYYSPTALKELIASLETVDSIAETDNVSKVILQQYWNANIDNVNLFASTEYPQIMLKVAATCTKNEDESPWVITAVPGVTWDDMREKQPTLMFNHSLSQEEYKSHLLYSNKNLDDIDQVPGASWALNHMTEREKEDTALKTVETVGLDSAQGMADVSEDPQTKSSSVASGNRTFGFSLIENRNAKKKKSIEDPQHCGVTRKEAHSELNSSVGEILIHNVLSIPTNQSEWQSSQKIRDCAREDAGSAHSQSNLSIVPANKLQKHAPLCESKVEEAHPPYEDVSDDDMSQLATELPNTEHGEFNSPACLQYEDISEAESQTESKVVNPSVSCSPSSVLNNEVETDDEMDDDYLVIPISIFNLKYEPEDDQDSPETIVSEGGETGVQERQCPTHCPFSNLALATAFPPVLVFDTQECFLQAVQCENMIEVELGISPLEHEMDSEGDVQTPQKRRVSVDGCETVDSCETEDSCDYSSASERNFLTVSREMLSKSSAPVPLETDDSTSEKEGEGNETKNLQKDQTRGVDKLRSMQKPRQPFQAEARCAKRVSLKREDVIIIDSDTEDEDDQKKAKIKRNRLHSSGGSEDSGNDTQFREATADACSDLFHSGPPIEVTGVSEHVLHNTNRQTTSKRRVDKHHSNEVVKNGHFKKMKAVAEGIFSSGSEDSSDDLFATNSRPIESVDRLCRTANAKPPKKQLSSGDSPEKQAQSVRKVADSHLNLNPVIPRFVAESSGAKGRLKLLKEPVVHTQGKDRTLSPETSTASSKKAKSCEKNKAHLNRNEKVQFPTPEPANNRNQGIKNNVWANVQKRAMVSRLLSLPMQEGPSTSFNSLSATGGQLRQSAVSSRGLSPSEAFSSLPYDPREQSVPPKLQRSYSNPSTLKHPPTKGPASTMQLNATGNAKVQVNSNHPIRRDGNNLRPGPSHHDRAGGVRAPRKRHNSHKPATSLMKRATNDAKQWTKAINRVSHKERRHSVGEGYKWSEKSTAKPTKGSSMDEKKGRSPPRPYL
ncbi:uncharacterized protein LOC116378412 isoform X1 [Anarrhichthys ocellatus]|uniref:uncharacterized protein LOC116378412 isoform X1 n=2 Tax=Anarrhichthys ocellatus TaxID=433405 RepID=UPI0012EE61A3|nr:uncharacterized protein LOC116378412 isoform X1 [Anarrhichthys ocellatus]